MIILLYDGDIDHKGEYRAVDSFENMEDFDRDIQNTINECVTSFFASEPDIDKNDYEDMIKSITRNLFRDEYYIQDEETGSIIMAQEYYNAHENEFTHDDFETTKRKYLEANKKASQ